MVNNNIPTKGNWEKSETSVFWGEIAPSDHLVQIYENEDVVLRSLEGFAESGFNAGDSVIVIAIEERLNALNERLKMNGFDLERLKNSHQYFPLNAHEILQKFMVDGWPNDELFTDTVKKIIDLARGKNKRDIRAYGEMVAILWGQGHNGATVQLEHLWNRLCSTEAFCLFCAYPKSGFTQDPETSIEHICSTHSKLIAGDPRSKKEVFYKACLRKRQS